MNYTRSLRRGLDHPDLRLAESGTLVRLGSFVWLAFRLAGFSSGWPFICTTTLIGRLVERHVVNFNDQELPEFPAVLAQAQRVKAQRAAVAHHYLTPPPASAAGNLSYSNLSFIIAGALAEARTGKS